MEKGACKSNKIPGASFKIASFSKVASGSEESLTQSIYLKGCISVAIDASPTTFQFYNDGIYNDPKCSSFRLNHGVLACGYGTDLNTTTDYYIIKNSWGSIIKILIHFFVFIKIFFYSRNKLG